MATNHKTDFTEYSGNTNTLNGELARIKHYVKLVKDEAKSLNLKDAANLEISDDSKLKDVAYAIRSIAHNDATDAQASETGVQKTTTTITLDAGKTATLPVGYYGSTVTVSATSLEDQSTGTATAKDLLDGTTAWVNGEQITGTSTTNLSAKAADNEAFGQKDSKLTINLKGSSEGAEDKIVTTNVVYNPTVVNKITIKKVTTADGETEATVGEAVTIPAGFYPSAVTVPVYVEDALGNEEKILNVASKEISGNITTFNASGEAEFTPDSDNTDYYTNVKVKKAVISAQDTTTGGYTVTSAGWINTTDTLPGLSEGSYVTTANTGATGDKGVTIVNGEAVINKATHGYTPNVIKATLPVSTEIADQTTVVVNLADDKASFETTVTIPAGYYEDLTVTIRGEQELSNIAGVHVVDVAGTSVKEEDKAKAITITNQYIKDSLTAGYFSDDDVKVYKVQDAVLGEGSVDIPNAKVTIPVTPGWRNDAVEFTYTTTLAATSFTPDSKGTKIAAGTYLTGDYTVNAVTVDNTNVTYNTASAVNIANVEGARVTTNSGSEATVSFYDTVDLSSLLTEMANV